MSRLFVAGDIHGSMMPLQHALKRVGFDKSQDQLWAVGDLVDRGPQSMDVLRLLNAPWFNSVFGNHEEMIVRGFQGDTAMATCSLQNGGGWFPLLEDHEMEEAVALMSAMPVMKTLQSPSGRKIGLVHAEPPTDDWDQSVAMIETPQVRAAALWGRGLILKRRQMPFGGIRNVDHVYCGHTPTEKVVQIENVSWIDTGACFSSGKLTLLEVL